jgi:beta-N-acetylglucosaminidase
MESLFESKRNRIIAERLITILLAVGLVVFNLVLWGKITIINTRVSNIEDQVYENDTANQKVLDLLNEIKQRQLQIEGIQQRQEDYMKKSMEAHAATISHIKTTGYSVNSDLSNTNLRITTHDMNKIINYWINHMGVSSQFKNRGYAFIKASKASGLNPIYILAHAAVESGWGSSYMAVNRHNYFGINCVDYNPDLGYTMGDDVEEGIVNGAVWISNNFYKNGYTTLQSMKDGNYATDPQWAYKISSIMDNSIKAL